MPSRRINKTMGELLHGIEHTGNGSDDLKVTGLSYNSCATQPGDVFFCVVGTATDGHRFAADACSRGAVALVVQRELDVDVPQFVVADSRSALALAAAEAFDHPSDRLDVIAITGTNGKTTTAFLVEWGLRCAGKTTGLIGTVETRVAGVARPASRTTPESLDLQALFADMVEAGVHSVAMEVSSHALCLGRTLGTRFSVAAFSNLTQDHLDYHRTMEAYFQAKRRLFCDYDVPRAAICVDDAYGRRLADECYERSMEVVTCGFDTTNGQPAMVHPQDVVYTASGTTFTLATPQGSSAVSMPLVGRFNIENALLATSILLLSGLSLEQVVHALEHSPQVPGRLERVQPHTDKPFSVLVDYAHTPDAIDKAVEVVNALATGRTIVVFGCGGDRDSTKRPKMGRAALSGDYCIVTSDNPRTEDPDAIIRDILPGMEGEEDRYEVICDRRAAIARAVSLAHPGDCVLIAGKGHENYQLVGDAVLPFDDREVAAEEMDAL